jgi:hypothetical protein
MTSPNTTLPEKPEPFDALATIMNTERLQNWKQGWFSNGPLPPLFHHYTTSDGFLGIIKNKDIWASDSRYLNDAREGVEFAAVIQRTVEEAINVIPDPLIQRKLTNIASAILQMSDATFVGCFSTVSDDLSQWRAYGNKSLSVQLSFRSEAFLLPSQMTFDFELVRCVYSPVEQRNRALALLNHLLVTYPDGWTTPTQEPHALGGLTEVVKASIKNEAFALENEWRLIRRAGLLSGTPVQFRSSGSMIVPYLAEPLRQVPSVLTGVVVGPTPHPVENERSVKQILAANGWTDTKVETSKIPYRTW